MLFRVRFAEEVEELQPVSVCVCGCVCVCVCERERERERCVGVGVCERERERQMCVCVCVCGCVGGVHSCVIALFFCSCISRASQQSQLPVEKSDQVESSPSFWR